MTNSYVNRLPVAALGAIVLGLLTSPALFMATGALSDFAPIVSLILLPLFVSGAGFLLWRYIGTASERSAHASLLWILEILCWVIVCAILAVISRGRLMTSLERSGAACLFLLIASVLYLPLTLLRPRALDRRLQRVSRRAVIGTVLIVLAVSVTLAAVYVVTPPAFIGGRPQPIGLLPFRSVQSDGALHPVHHLGVGHDAHRGVI